MKAQAVIFDLDGTLLNTLDDLTAALNVALTGMGKSSVDKARVRKFVGNGVPKLISRALNFVSGVDPDGEGTPDGFDECLARFTDYYNAHSADLTDLYAGAAEMLEAVKAFGLKTAVVTNKYDQAAQRLKKRFFDGVDAVVGARADIRPKPAPDGTLLAMQRLGAQKDGCVYVGDGETDVATAKNCGIPMIAVTWGFRDRAELEPLSPDRIIDRPDELIAALRSLGRL